MQIRWKFIFRVLILMPICMIIAMSDTGIRAYAKADSQFSTLEDKPKRAVLLMVSSVSYNTAGITWLPQGDAEGYDIYRSESSDESTYTKIAEVEDVSYYEDTGLTIGVKYYYRICAYKTVDGEKVYGELSLSLNSDITLSKPAKVKAKSVSYEEIALTWAAVDDAEGYIVYRSTVEDQGYKEIERIEGHNICQFSQKNLTTGQKYYYRVEAYRQKDGKVLVSPMSDIVKAVPSVKAVQNVKVTSSSYHTANLEWDSADGADGYVIYRSVHKDKNYEEVAAVSGKTQTSYQDTGLVTGKKYYYYIRAYRNVKGEMAQGFASKKVSVKPVLKQVEVDESSKPVTSGIKLVWEKVVGADGYWIYRCDKSDGKFSKIGTVKKSSSKKKKKTNYSYKDTKVTDGTEYFYKVYAYREVQNKRVKSKASEVISLRALPAQTEITDIFCQDDVDIVLKFKTVMGANGYLIERSDTEDGEFKEVTRVTEFDTEESTLSYTDTLLASAKTYYYRVTAYETIDETDFYGKASEAAKQKTKKVATDTEGNKVSYGSGLSATEEEIRLMTALCEREAGTNYANCLAVANVVINRVKSGNYPNSIRGVIYQRGQFEGVNSGILNRYLPNPKEICRQAVVDALAGKNNIGTRKSFRASWYYRSRGMHKSGALTIGDNTFFSEG